MKSTWNRMLFLSAALAGLPTWASAADSWPVVSNQSAAQNRPQRIVMPIGVDSGSGAATQRSSISFVNASSDSTDSPANDSPATKPPGSAPPAVVYRRPAPKRTDGSSRRVTQAQPRQLTEEAAAPQRETVPQRTVKPAASVKTAVPRLMTESYPAQLDDPASSLQDDDYNAPSSRRRRAGSSEDSANVASSSRRASQPMRLRVPGESSAPMALATDDVPQRIPPITEDNTGAPQLLTATPNEQLATARPLATGARSEMSGPALRRAPLADRLAALQDQVPTSYVGIQGRVGAINLGDQTVKLNFDRRQPPPMGGVVKVYQAHAQGTTCVGALKIIRVYGGVATGAPVGDLEVQRLMAGDLAVFHVGAELSIDEPDPNEVIWVSDRIRSNRR